jgi:hypothetical protein
MFLLPTIDLRSHRPHIDCRSDELIYVYDLPPMFNVDVVGPSCAASKFWSIHPRNACVIYSPDSGGIGPRLTGTEVALLNEIGSPVESWADTGQFALEIMFHRVSQTHSCSSGSLLMVWSETERSAVRKRSMAFCTFGSDCQIESGEDGL